MIHLNFSCLIRNEKDGYCIAYGKIIPKQTFFDYARELFYKESNKNKSRRICNNHLFPKFEKYTSIRQIENNFNYHRSETYGDSDDGLPLLLYYMRIKNIEKNYNDYLSIVGKFRISNPGTQHTSSFHPLELKTMKDHESLKIKFLGDKYIKHDHSTPDIICFLIHSKIMIIMSAIRLSL